VAIVGDRIDARVVRVAFLVEDAKGPGGLPADRVVRRAVPPHGLAAGVLERSLGRLDVATEALRAQAVDGAVVPAVRGELVSALDDGADEPGMALGDHPEGEERPARA